ncbi:nitrate reductase [Sulfurimonas aquatica]|uniref:Periplasmic nitrate reductase, electron transfer subunit n=1 Tax=Sulfurimonas aquatica TaxID=2672570 RepID=A0A975GD51_9BACT|nr:nitrate reductase cytochrome c-type subunit [Sulfurimonas aquatica]QSZ42320.1 nitrate reductase [Sulfurimonas aquatica]
MKLINKITLGLVTATLILVGCGGSATPAEVVTEAKAVASVSEESLGLRKTDIYAEDDTLASKTSYRSAQPGTSTKIKRAYQDAPPMIPHDVSDFLPITADYNACVGCHAPDIAPAMGATPIPPSHYLDMRPRHICDGVKFKKSIDNTKNETDVKKLTHLSQARFNCSQCHAPQSQGNPSVENLFEANFTKDGGEFKSSWDEVVLDDLNTVGEDSRLTEDDLDNSDSAAGHLKGSGH